jgi:hypothetical protein
MEAWRRNRPDEFEVRAANKTRLSSVQSAQSAVLISVSGVKYNSAECRALLFRSWGRARVALRVFAARAGGGLWNLLPDPISVRATAPRGG